MSEQDRAFDQMLEETLTELPLPEPTVKQINPWKRPMGYIAWGFALITVHFELLHLELIMPMVGMLLFYFGTRILREENRWFRAAWIMAALHALYFGGSLVLLTQPPVEWVMLILQIGGMALQLAMLLVLRAGVREVYRAAGKKPDSDPLLWAFFWLLAVVAVGHSPLAHSWLAAVPVLVAYGAIVWAMWRLGGLLGNTGYYLHDAPVRLRGAVISVLYVAGTAALVALGCVNANHLILQAEPYEPVPTAAYAGVPVAEFPSEFPEETESAMIYVERGIPEETLAMLSEEEIALFRDAIWIESWRELLMFDPEVHRHQAERTPSHIIAWETYSPGRRNLVATTTYAVMPDRRVYLVYAFQWQDGTPVWQDGIQVASTDQRYGTSACLNSALFYEKEGKSWTAPLPRWNEERLSGALSFPFGAEHQRGYVLCRVDYKENVLLNNASLSYYQMRSPLHLPFIRVEEMEHGGWINPPNEVSQVAMILIHDHVAEYEANLRELQQYYADLIVN